MRLQTVWYQPVKQCYIPGYRRSYPKHLDIYYSHTYQWLYIVSTWASLPEALFGHIYTHAHRLGPKCCPGVASTNEELKLVNKYHSFLAPWEGQVKHILHTVSQSSPTLHPSNLFIYVTLFDSFNSQS